MEQTSSITTTTVGTITASASTTPSIVTGVATILDTISSRTIQPEESTTPGLPTGGGTLSIGGGGLSERSISGAPSATPSPVLSPPGRIYGRNANGTMVATSTPSNEAELQLYRVLQRASLLAYYDTLLEMGGDDVQQLCDAGEEEFLEIMALVGMASKPLHVRRLQKALHEWANNPTQFQTPLPSSSFTETPSLLYTPEPSTSRTKFTVSPSFTPTPLMSTATNIPQTSAGYSPLTATVTPQVTSSSPQLTPVLTDAQISRIQSIAEKMVRQIPQKEPRQQSSKKRTSRELEQVMAMSENDPRRMDEIRKYAAIYGRFDCKRRPEKPLTLHEVSVNEGAAQICKFIPALLTRRDELFPLARQLVKDAGFGHSASIARYGMTQQPTSLKTDEPDASAAKRTRLTSTETSTSDYTKDFLDDTRINLFAMYQKFAKPSFDLSDISKFSLSRSDYDEENDNDNDSRFSFSTSSSPPLPLGSEAGDGMNNNRGDNNNTNENGKNDLIIIKSPNHNNDNLMPTTSFTQSSLGIQIISASGNHIIAVANPALAMSPALNDSFNIKRETTSPEI